MAMFLGAGKRHGETNFTSETPMQYTIMDRLAAPEEEEEEEDQEEEEGGMASLIVAGTGLGDLKFTDEEFYKMTYAPTGIHNLASVVIAATPSGVSGGGAGQTVSQLWTYEHTLPGGQPARAFVWMQGHVYSNFSNPVIQKVLLRGIAWAGNTRWVSWRPTLRRRSPRAADAVAVAAPVVPALLAAAAPRPGAVTASHETGCHPNGWRPFLLRRARRSSIPALPGWVAEWLMAPVLKTGVPVRVP